MGDGWFNLAGGSRGSEQWSEGIHFQRVQLGSLNDRSQSRNQARPECKRRVIGCFRRLVSQRICDVQLSDGT